MHIKAERVVVIVEIFHPQVIVLIIIIERFLRNIAMHIEQGR